MRWQLECSYDSPKSSFPRSISLAFCFSLVSFRNHRSKNLMRSSSRFALGRSVKIFEKYNM